MDYGRKRPRTSSRQTYDHYSADRPTSAFDFEDGDDDTTSQEKELIEAMSRLNLKSIDQATKPILTCGELIRDYRDNIDRSWKISEELERLMLEGTKMNDPPEFTETEKSESSMSSIERSKKIQYITDMLASTKLSDQRSLEQEIMSQLEALSVERVDDKDTEVLERIGQQIEAMNVKEKTETEKLVQLKNLTFSYELIKDTNANKYIQSQNDQVYQLMTEPSANCENVFKKSVLWFWIFLLRWDESRIVYSNDQYTNFMRTIPVSPWKN